MTKWIMNIATQRATALLHQLQAERNLTQAELAKQLGISQSWLSKWLTRGVSRPGIGIVQRWSGYPASFFHPPISGVPSPEVITAVTAGEGLPALTESEKLVLRIVNDLCIANLAFRQDFMKWAYERLRLTSPSSAASEGTADFAVEAQPPPEVKRRRTRRAHAALTLEEEAQA